MIEPKNKEVKAGIWFAICNVLQKSSMILSIPIFTRLMSRADYGMNAVFQSWNSILIIIVTLNLAVGGFNTGMIEFKDDRDQFVSSLQGLSTLLAFFCLIIVLFFRRHIVRIIGLPEDIVILMFISYITQPAFDYWSARNRYEYKYKSLLLATFLYSAITIIIPYITVISSHNKGQTKIKTTIIVIILFTLFFYILNFYKGRIFPKLKYWKYMLWFNIPLVPHYLSGILLAQADRIMIQKINGDIEAGIYSIAASLQGIFAIALTAVNSAFIPWLFECLEISKYKNISNKVEKLIIFMAYITIGIVSYAPEIIGIMASEDYIESIYAVPPIIYGGFITLMCAMFSDVELFYKRRIFMTCATVVATVFNIVSNYLLIPIYGYIICAYTTALSYLVYAIMHYFFMNRIVVNGNKIKSFKLFDLRNILLIYISTLFIIMLQFKLYNSVLIRSLVIIILSLGMFGYWRKAGEKNKY